LHHPLRASTFICSIYGVYHFPLRINISFINHQDKVSGSVKDFLLTIIARRSRNFAGPRFVEKVFCTINLN
jgi:hypothetical protein